MTEAGFRYGTSATNLSESIVATLSGSAFNAQPLLASNTTYYFAAYVKIGTYEFTGAAESFTTLPAGPYMGCMEMPDVNNTYLTYTSSSLGKEYVHQTANASQHVITHTYSDTGRELRNYTILYDNDKFAALWVAYPLNYDLHLNGTKYSNNNDPSWLYNPCSYIPSTSQIDVRYYSYPEKRPETGSSNSNKWDRGHQLPNADRSYTSQAAVNQTYLTSNQTPQYWSFNQNKWMELEVQVRNWASACDTLYVVTGPLYIGTATTTEDNSGRTIPVPSHYFKVLLQSNWSNGTMTNASGIGFIMENTANESATAYTTAGAASSSSSFTCGYMSIEEVERVSGFTFFRNLPDAFSAAKTNDNLYAF